MTPKEHLYNQIKSLFQNYWPEISKCHCQKEAHVQKLAHSELTEIIYLPNSSKLVQVLKKKPLTQSFFKK